MLWKLSTEGIQNCDIAYTIFTYPRVLYIRLRLSLLNPTISCMTHRKGFDQIFWIIFCIHILNQYSAVANNGVEKFTSVTFSLHLAR